MMRYNFSSNFSAAMYVWGNLDLGDENIVGNHGQGDAMDWTDWYTTLVCDLFAEQVRKGNRPNTHLNNVGFSEVSDRFFQSTAIMLSKIQLKNKWDKLRRDFTAWRKLMRKQTGVGFNWDSGTINMDKEWWKKIVKVSFSL